MKRNDCIFYSGNSNEECMNSAYSKLKCPYGDEPSRKCPCYLKKQHTYSAAPGENLSTKSLEKIKYVTDEDNY